MHYDKTMSLEVCYVLGHGEDWDAALKRPRLQQCPY
jgi:hypothetical protein